MNRPEHRPDGDPCARCTLAASLPRTRANNRHAAAYRAKAEHSPIGDPCAECGRPRSEHYTRKSSSNRHAPTYRRKARRITDDLVVAVDGEGQGRAPHVYTYLAAADEHGNQLGAIHDPKGLGTKACLDFLLDLGARRVFGFAFQYDLTMILRELPPSTLWKLTHERSRIAYTKAGKPYFRPLYWSGFMLNYLNRKLTIRRAVLKDGRMRGSGNGVQVWDIFRFFACKFTQALMDWQIADRAKLERMAAMKDQRGNFDKLSPSEIHAYCQEECIYLARLIRGLFDAHVAIGLTLKNFFGAGSTANALLSVLGVKPSMAPPPIEAEHAIGSAFFGGRFETARVGPILGPVWSADISSAYPYQTSHLPCLVHGRWERVSGRGTLARIRRARHLKRFSKANRSRYGVRRSLPTWMSVFPRMPRSSFRI